MAETERDLQPGDWAIIHNIYDNGSAREHFEFELDQALEAKRRIIIIEPAHLGDETARWITVGNCLHKTSVLSGMACLVAPALLPNQAVNFVTFPTGTVSVACALLYGVSWQSDPCCKYQVEYDTRSLSRLPLHSLTTATPVVLVRKDDKYRKALHNFVAGLAAALLAYRVYQWCIR